MGKLNLQVILLLGASVGYVKSQSPCDSTGFDFSKQQCPGGMEEIYEERASGQFNTVCCDPNHEDFKAYKNSATACRVTTCSSASSANLCSTFRDRYVDGSKLEYDEILRETCDTKEGGVGSSGLCCLKNSTEGALATTLGAEPGEFPHQTKLFLPGHCGGTIYNKRFIVTAAHCIVDKYVRTLKPASNMKAIIGTNNADTKSEKHVYKVKRAIPHPKYSRLNPNRDRSDRIFNDIALLELDRDIVFGPKVKALEIAPKGFQPLDYASNAVIVGWGTTDTLDVSIHLQKANFVIRSDQRCFVDGPHWDMNDMPEQLLCVGGVMDNKWSPTAGGGDSGGPAICRGADGKALLCGVTSYGGDDEKCKNNKDADNCPPSVYAEVAHFRDWIEKHAGKQDPSTFYKPYLYGEPVPRGKYMHQVHITSKDGKSCGGTLIAKDTVVTAAQCVVIDSKNGRRGVRVTDQNGNTFKIREKGLVLLPGFKMVGKPVNVTSQKDRIILTDNYYTNDMAILKLDGEVDISPRNLAELPTSEVSGGENAIEVSRPRDPKKNDQLMARDFKILDRADCQNRMNRLSTVGYKDKIDDNVLCGVEKYNGGSQCDRELGGGLICKGKGGKDVLCGVQMFRLCESTIPNGFINTGMYANWLKKSR